MVASDTLTIHPLPVVPNFWRSSPNVVRSLRAGDLFTEALAVAGDWIKMRVSLQTHPKVMRIAAMLEEDRKVSQKLSTGYNGGLLQIVTRDVTRDVTLASLLRVWGAANEHTEDGVWHGIALSDLDQIAGVPGFGSMMEDVGWAIYDEEEQTVTLPNFLEYNAPAKSGRGSAADRQRRYRERKAGKSDVTRDVTRDVTDAVTRDVTRDVEKRREEKKGNTTITEPEKALLFSSKAYPSAEFNQAWKNFCEHCFQKTGTRFTDFEIDAKLLHLAQWQDEKRAIAALEYSIRCGSKSSIFEDDSKHRANGNGKPKEDLVDVLRRTMK